MKHLSLVAALALAGCGPATGLADADTTLDVADVVEAGPSLDAPGPDETPTDTGTDESSAPTDASADASAPDALTCSTDMDGDGHIAASCGGDDCDDSNRRAGPGRPPSCGGARRDLNCNALRDETESYEERTRTCLEEWPAAIEGISVPGGLAPIAPARCSAIGTTHGTFRCRICWRASGSIQCGCWDSGYSPIPRAQPCS